MWHSVLKIQPCSERLIELVTGTLPVHKIILPVHKIIIFHMMGK